MLPDLKVSISPPVRLYQETKDFLRFLHVAALKHSVSITSSADDSGTFTIYVPGKDCWNLDSFLQEIVLHRGLYYYLCGVINRREVAKLVVSPIFQELRSSRFSVTYPVQILRHLLDGTPHWAGGELLESTAHQYEILFQKLNLKEISGYEFIRETDDLLTQWMLQNLTGRIFWPSVPASVLLLSKRVARHRFRSRPHAPNGTCNDAVCACVRFEEEPMTLSMHLRIVGILLVLLGLSHAFFNRYFG